MYAVQHIVVLEQGWATRWLDTACSKLVMKVWLFSLSHIMSPTVKCFIVFHEDVP